MILKIRQLDMSDVAAEHHAVVVAKTCNRRLLSEQPQLFIDLLTSILPDKVQTVPDYRLKWTSEISDFSLKLLIDSKGLKAFPTADAIEILYQLLDHLIFILEVEAQTSKSGLGQSSLYGISASGIFVPAFMALHKSFSICDGIVAKLHEQPLVRARWSAALMSVWDRRNSYEGDRSFAAGCGT